MIDSHFVCRCDVTLYVFGSSARDVFRWQHGTNPEASLVLRYPTDINSGPASTLNDWLAEIHERENGIPRPASWRDWRDSKCLVANA